MVKIDFLYISISLMPRINEYAHVLLDKVRKYFEDTDAIRDTLDSNIAFSYYAYYRDLLFHLDPYVDRNEYLKVSEVSKLFYVELEKRYGVVDYPIRYDFGRVHEMIAALNNAKPKDHNEIENSHKKLLTEDYYTICDFFRVYDGAYADYQERVSSRRIINTLDRIFGWWIFI